MTKSQQPPSSDAAAGPAPMEALMQLLFSVFTSRAVTFAADAGIADLLRDGPRSAGEIAEQLGYREEPVYRVLRALTVPGVFEEHPERRFALTPISQHLRSDGPGSVQALAAHFGFASFWHALAEIEHTMKTGGPSFEKANGAAVWDYFKQHPRESSVFDRAMTEASSSTAKPVATAYDFSDIRQLVDVGGGRGGLLAAILQQYPDLQGTLYDQEHVVEGAPALLREAGVEDRVTVEGGSFLDRVPEGADAYIMKAIIHDWDDAHSVKILRNCREAMAPDGRILVVNRVVTDQLQSDTAKIADLVMMIIAGGKERTKEEFSELLTAAGLKLVRIVPTDSIVSVIEARAA